MPLRLAPRWPRRSLRLLPERHHCFWPAHTPRAAFRTYRPHKRQDVSAFALTYSLRLRSCKSMDAFVISSLPSRLKETLQTEGPLCSTDVTPLHRSYGPIRHPLVVDRFPG